ENIARRHLPRFGAAALGAAAAVTAAPLAAPAHPPRGPARTAAGAADLPRRMRVPTAPAPADRPLWCPPATGLPAPPTDQRPPRGPERTADGAADLLRRMRVPTGPATADGPVWSPLATGFASVPTDELPLGAVGGLGGPVIDVTTAEELADALQHDGPAVVLV